MGGPAVDTVVIGAGLSGLATALLLCQRGESLRVVEARPSPGGRVRSVFDAGGAFLGDLGPTWIWPVVQPVMKRWIATLGVETFPQYRSGKVILDHGPGRRPEVLSLPHPTDEVRVVGGSQALVDRLSSGLASGTLLADWPVASVRLGGDGCEVESRAGEVLRSQRVVVAAPPRVALRTISFEPGLPAALSVAMAGTPTWMAPHAKVVAVYSRPFWRARGLSGRVASRAGPIAEAHDHCGPDGSPAALYGFLGWPAEVREEAREQLEELVRDQLRRCFGADSPEPLSVRIEEWATDPYVASPEDLALPMEHPDVRPAVLREAHAGGRLLFAGAETATRSPGLIEGAFSAAERVASCPLPT